MCTQKRNRNYFPADEMQEGRYRKKQMRVTNQGKHMARGKKHHSRTKRKKRVFNNRDKWNTSEKDKNFPVRKKFKSNEGDQVVTKKRKLISDVEISRQNYSGSSDEENGDPYKELLLSFTADRGRRQRQAIESSSESEYEANSGCQNEVSKTHDTESEHEENDTSKNISYDVDSGSGSEEEETVNLSLDPFTRHFSCDLDEHLLQAVSSNPVSTDKVECSWPILGQFITHIPKLENVEVAKHKSKAVLEDDKHYAEPGSIPQRINSINWDSLHIKTQIQPNITKANFKNLANKNSDPLTPLQKELFSIINNYQDLYYPERTLKNGEEVRFIYCLHAINHILKTRTKIVHHNQKLQDKIEVPEEYRDQGLVRPKVLIIVPFKDSALRVVKMLIEILIPDEKANIMNKKRFFDEFTGNELAMPKKNPRPEDYEATFTGNVDDTFRIGIAVTKKSLKLYADFYSADIIIASPLGLRVIVGAEGEEGRDFDFLASIELLILDQAEIFLMQNWDHLLHVLDHFHLQPQDSHGTDFSRVRTWALNGWTRYYRQTLLFSSLLLPELNSLFNKRCYNYTGKIQIVNPILSGSICEVVVPLPQVFHRFEAHSTTHAIDARFEFFLKTFSQFKETLMKHVLIYIPSYFDYVQVRNYFKHEDLKFVQICEYSKEGKIARARDMFFHGDAYFLLYSERFHFFRRPRIKGIRHLIFYQPPTFPQFYSEMCNLMQEANQNKAFGNESNMTVTILYTKYDVQRLAAIIGTDRVARMVNSERNVHMFMTGE